MKNLLKRVELLTFLIFCLGLTSCLNTVNENEVKAQADIIASIDIMNKNLPVQIDEHTTAEKVTYDSNKKEFIMFYKIQTKNFTKKDIEDTFKDIEKYQFKNAKVNKNNKNNFKILNVTMVFIYNNLKGEEVWSFKITPNEYLK